MSRITDRKSRSFDGSAMAMRSSRLVESLIGGSRPEVISAGGVLVTCRSPRRLEQRVVTGSVVR